MTISPESVWKTLSLWYQIPNPKLPTLDTVGRNTQRAQMDSDVTHDIVASGTTHVQIHLPNHETFTTPTSTSRRSSNMTHPLILIVASRIPWKHEYTASPLPSRFQPYHFPRQAQHSLKSSSKQTPQQHATSCPSVRCAHFCQIQNSNDPPTVYNPMETPNPLEPVSQVDLVCKRQNKYETLTFQVLPDSSIGCKPALMSGSDSERLGLIKVHADEIHSLSSKVENTSAEHENLPGFQSSHPWEVAPQHVESIPEPKTTLACNHLR